MNILKEITEKATHAYSGERGCCCGCLWDYFYRTNSVTKEDGYIWRHRTGETVSDPPLVEKNIKRIAGEIWKAYNDDNLDKWVHVWETGISVTKNDSEKGRIYTLYFD